MNVFATGGGLNTPIFFEFHTSASAVPEPGTLALVIATGAGGAMFLRRRKARS